MESAQNLTDSKPDISCQYQNPGRLCDICKKVRIEIPVIHRYMQLRLNCDLLEVFVTLEISGAFYRVR